MEQANQVINFDNLTIKKDVSKSEKAKVVFMDCYKNGVDKAPQRKDIIKRLMDECGLTQNGAATYLQNMKSKAGLVVKKK